MTGCQFVILTLAVQYSKLLLSNTFKLSSFRHEYGRGSADNISNMLVLYRYPTSYAKT